MSVVQNREIRNMVLLNTFGLLLTYYCFGFLDKFDACMTEKNTVLVIYKHKRVKSIVFAVPIEFCDESVLAIFTVMNMTNHISFIIFNYTELWLSGSALVRVYSVV